VIQRLKGLIFDIAHTGRPRDAHLRCKRLPPWSMGVTASAGGHDGI
jgi:hypothetical protein